MQTLQAIQQQVKAAIRRGDWEMVARLRQWLIVQQYEHTDRRELLAFLEPHARQLEANAENGSKKEIALALLLLALLKWFESRVYLFAQSIGDKIADDVLGQLNRAQLSAALELPIGRDNEIIPPATEIPPSPPDEIERKDLLLLLSPLLAAGAAVGVNAKELLFGGALSRGRTAVRAESSRETVQWRTGLRFNVDQAKSRILQATESEAIRRALGLTGTGGLLGSVNSRLRHEKLRILGDTRMDAGEAIGTVYIGTQINSRFLPTTAPDHAAAHGERFYKDDRPGGDFPWAQRKVGPWGHPNCVCYNTPLYEDMADRIDVGDEFELRIDRTRTATIRNPYLTRQWFNSQQQAIRRKFVGDERYFAALSSGAGIPEFSDFFQSDGKMIPPRRLLGQSQRERLLSRERINRIIDAKNELHNQGFQRHQFRAGADVEAEYWKILNDLLRGI